MWIKKQTYVENREKYLGFLFFLWIAVIKLSYFYYKMHKKVFTNFENGDIIDIDDNVWRLSARKIRERVSRARSVVIKCETRRFLQGKTRRLFQYFDKNTYSIHGDKINKIKG